MCIYSIEGANKPCVYMLFFIMSDNITKTQLDKASNSDSSDSIRIRSSAVRIAYGYKTSIFIIYQLYIEKLLLGADAAQEIHANKRTKLLSVLLAFLPIFLALATESLFGMPRGMVAIFIVVYYVMFLIVLAFVTRTNRRKTARSLCGRCRRCGYDLEGHESVWSVELFERNHPSGPPLCPECGQGWPLLLP